MFILLFPFHFVILFISALDRNKYVLQYVPLFILQYAYIVHKKYSNIQMYLPKETPPLFTFLLPSRL